MPLLDISFPAKEEGSNFSYRQWRNKGLPDRVIDGAYL
jgi:hypothetical protein